MQHNKYCLQSGDTMKYELESSYEEPVILLGTEIVYGHRPKWCEGSWRTLKLSILRQRQFFSYDEVKSYPTLLWLTGGGFTNIDRNVWTPELTWFAKRGYAVISIDYGVAANSRFPEQVEDIKLAIRFLRAHASELALDTRHMCIMGESAGGYLSALVALSSNTHCWDRGEYLEYSSSVDAAISFYPVVENIENELHFEPRPLDFKEYPALTSLMDFNCPPFLIFHGDKDSCVDVNQRYRLYKALQERNITSDLYVIHGAEHADFAFFQPKIKKIVLNFLDNICKK